jgi:glycosyltransferase involved in cell wall biosynthesis
MSTNNSFYRYKIDDINDISESTYLRRLIKASQNNKKSFFYEVSISTKYSELKIDFIAQKLKQNDLILCQLKDFEHYLNKVSSEYIVIEISNANVLLKLKSKLDLFKDRSILFTPRISSDLKAFAAFYKAHKDSFNIYWMFFPYDENLIGSITAKEISKYSINFKTITGLEIFNTKIPPHYELEPISNTSYNIEWEFTLADSKPIISVIIPSFNNSQFLSNVVLHLINQNIDPKLFEIIICDDGSTDNSSTILKQLFQAYQKSVNIKYIYWSKQHPQRGEQQFFRSGLARNLASRYSRGEYLQFLDSDIIVPPNFIEICINELKQNDLIQFQRFHINQELSKTSPHYYQVNLKSDTYIEEKEYWSELFFSDNWSQLPHYWKYTCTYALGIAKSKFYDLGLFKKYYVSYGFEDTDLGYESHKRNLKFKLVKRPLLHLTSYDKMQYKNSITRRFKLLRVTAELFYIQHLDPEIFNLLGNYFRAQKPLKSFFRDLFS